MIIPSAADLTSSFGDKLESGVYLVGTGNSGASATSITLGILYLIVMAVAAFAYRVPAEDWTPKG